MTIRQFLKFIFTGDRTAVKRKWDMVKQCITCNKEITKEEIRGECQCYECWAGYMYRGDGNIL